MFYFVDESGNTGSQLFDPNQPNLYYGVLGCRTNLDITAEPMVRRLRRELGVIRLHANELGTGRLIPVALAFTRFQKKNDVRFNFYTVVKADHAVISFFDQVFDSGMNEAVPYHFYWTPLRYILLLKVSELFDDNLRRRAWAARLEQSRERCAASLRQLCVDLRARDHLVPDARSREIIRGGLEWAEARPEDIAYGTSNRESALQISPNLIGFQQVMQGIAQSSARMNRQVRSIIVDRQNEFNSAQAFLADIYRRLRGAEFEFPHGMPNFDWRHMPEQPPEFKPGDTSVGLEMVDVYLWIMKRYVEGRDLPDELIALLNGQRNRGRTDEVSLSGMDQRWAHLAELPPTPAEAIADVGLTLDAAERSRLLALAALRHVPPGT